MSQTRLYVTTNQTHSEALLNRLEIEFEEDGFAIATTETDEENEIWETSIYVDKSQVSDTEKRFENVLHALQINKDVSVEILPEIDWVAHSLEGLKPVQTGRFLVHGSHDYDTVAPHQLAIQINAAQAFGTGHHGTTAGCLEIIENTSKQHPAGLRGFQPILDLGSGSGVLAIAAAKLGADQILATDIDPIATDTATENANINQVGTRIDFATANGFSAPVFKQKGPFGLIIANILARPLMTMAPSIAENLKPGGTVILSGILANQRWKVLSAFNNQGLGHVNTIWRDGWVTITLK